MAIKVLYFAILQFDYKIIIISITIQFCNEGLNNFVNLNLNFYNLFNN
jgi:hypothetical protein